MSVLTNSRNEVNYTSIECVHSRRRSGEATQPPTQGIQIDKWLAIAQPKSTLKLFSSERSQNRPVLDQPNWESVHCTNQTRAKVPK